MIKQADKPNPKRGGRLSGVEVTNRISQVIDLLALDYERREIILWVQEETDWKVAKATIDGYIMKARARIRRFVDEPLEDSKSRAILELKAIYKAAIRLDSLGIALAARKELSKMQGLYGEEFAVSQPVVDEDADIGDLLQALEPKAQSSPEVAPDPLDLE